MSPRSHAYLHTINTWNKIQRSYQSQQNHVVRSLLPFLLYLPPLTLTVWAPCLPSGEDIPQDSKFKDFSTWKILPSLIHVASLWLNLHLLSDHRGTLQNNFPDCPFKIKISDLPDSVLFLSLFQVFQCIYNGVILYFYIITFLYFTFVCLSGFIFLSVPHPLPITLISQHWKRTQFCSVQQFCLHIVDTWYIFVQWVNIYPPLHFRLEVRKSMHFIKIKQHTIMTYKWIPYM